MTLMESIKNSPEKAKVFIEQQLLERRKRIATPEFQAKMEAMKDKAYKSLENACKNGMEAGVSFLLGGPWKSICAGWNSAVSVHDHNQPLNEELSFLKKIYPTKKNDPKTIEEFRKHKKFLNDKADIEKRKKSYAAVPVEMLKALMIEWGHGGASTLKAAVNISGVLGRPIVIGARYLVGK